MWSARRRPARVSGPAPRTNDIDTDERRQTIPQRGRPTANRAHKGVDKRCLISHPCGYPTRQRPTRPGTDA
jgi:hypothetical protein